MIRPTIGLLLGDRNGIGPEIATKLLADPVLAAGASLVAIGDPAVLAYGCKVSGAQLPDDLRFINRTNCAHEPIGSGKVSAAAGAEMLDHLAFALTLFRAGEIHGIVFAPFNKQAMRLGGLAKASPSPMG